MACHGCGRTRRRTFRSVLGGATMPLVRPRRRYIHTFVNEQAAKPIILPALGDTPCKAKNQAFVYLERLLQVDPTLPPNSGSSRWRLLSQQDAGLAE